MAAQVALVIGAGKNIGAHTVQTFKTKGFKVAQAARSVKDELLDGVLSISCDLAQPTSLSSVFEKVRKTFGEPSIVVYNAYAAHNSKPEDSLSLSVAEFEKDLAVNTTSVFAAIRESISSFQSFSATVPKTFIFTGNMLNEGAFPGLFTLGLGKAASAHMIDTADQLYRDQDIRFFYVDERHADGTPMFTGLGGQSHADMFWSLAERSAGTVPWQITFVAGKGYVEFPHKLILPNGS